MVSPEIGKSISKSQAFASFSNLGQKEEQRYFMEYRLREGMSRNGNEHLALSAKSKEKADKKMSETIQMKTKQSVVSSYLKSSQPNMDPIALADVEKLNELQIAFRNQKKAKKIEEQSQPNPDKSKGDTSFHYNQLAS